MALLPLLVVRLLPLTVAVRLVVLRLLPLTVELLVLALLLPLTLAVFVVAVRVLPMVEALDVIATLGFVASVRIAVPPFRVELFPLLVTFAPVRPVLDPPMFSLGRVRLLLVLNVATEGAPPVHRERPEAEPFEPGVSGGFDDRTEGYDDAPIDPDDLFSTQPVLRRRD